MALPTPLRLPRSSVQRRPRIITFGWRQVLLSALVLIAVSPTMTLAQAPRQGPPGSLFTVRAGGFRSFELVESIELGGLGLMGSRTIYTDGDGVFTAEDLQVPGLDPGVYALVLTVGSGRRRTTTSNTFEITGQRPTAAGVTPATGLAPLLDADNLEWAFYFRNSTKHWHFYDPRTTFALANTLDMLFEREVYWIKVRRDQVVTLNGKAQRLSCVNEDTPSENCWNVVVW